MFYSFRKITLAGQKYSLKCSSVIFIDSLIFHKCSVETLKCYKQLINSLQSLFIHPFIYSLWNKYLLKSCSVPDIDDIKMKKTLVCLQWVHNLLVHAGMSEENYIQCEDYHSRGEKKVIGESQKEFILLFIRGGGRGPGRTPRTSYMHTAFWEMLM